MKTKCSFRSFQSSRAILHQHSVSWALERFSALAPDVRRRWKTDLSAVVLGQASL